MMKDTMVVDVSQDWATSRDVQQRFMHKVAARGRHPLRGSLPILT